MTGDLTTLANVKQWLTLGPGNTAPDDLLSRLISAASTFIQSWLNRVIAVAEYSEVRNGQGTPVMLASNYPIINVSSVTVDGIPIQVRGPLGPTMTGNGAPSYVFDQLQIMLNGCVFPRGFQNVALVYTAGYAATPADIEQACIDMIGDWFKYKDRIGTLSQGIEGQTISFTNSGLPSRSRDVLQQYKRVVTPL